MIWLYITGALAMLLAAKPKDGRTAPNVPVAPTGEKLPREQSKYLDVEKLGPTARYMEDLEDEIEDSIARDPNLVSYWALKSQSQAVAEITAIRLYSIGEKQLAADLLREGTDLANPEVSQHGFGGMKSGAVLVAAIRKMVANPTADNVSTFQSSIDGLKVDGKLGPKTAAAASALMAEQVEPDPRYV